jgi:hypothetical protein
MKAHSYQSRVLWLGIMRRFVLPSYNLPNILRFIFSVHVGRREAIQRQKDKEFRIYVEQLKAKADAEMETRTCSPKMQGLAYGMFIS